MVKAVERATGRYEDSIAAGVPVKAFVPYDLPPEPRLDLSVEDFDLLERANRALGRLDGLTDLIPDTSLFIYFYVRKEAVLSSQIEGTQSSLQELLLFEREDNPGIPLDETQQVSNYVRALNYSNDQLRGNGLPLSNRLIRDAHRILLSRGRGSTQTPGEFRDIQNWLGGTNVSPRSATFIPPPPNHVQDAMSKLEMFLHDKPTRTPTLIKVALAHVQFETIHPFLDGNGRVGRLLIPLTLCAENVLSQPLLYLSLFFKTNRGEYYRRLQAVRDEGDWEGWLRFFLEGVTDTAGKAVAAARRLLDLFETDRQRLRQLGRAAGSAMRVHEYLKTSPVISSPTTAAALGLSGPTVDRAIASMESMEIVREITGMQRRRQYAYAACLDILSEGTEPIG